VYWAAVYWAAVYWAALHWASGRAAEAASAAQPHHRTLDFARTRHWDLHELAGMRVTIIWHALGANDLEGLSYLRRGELDDNALLAEVGKHLTADQEAVLRVLRFAVYIFPGAESLDNRGKWIHWGKKYTDERPTLPA
jgi:hypothetical protein